MGTQEGNDEMRPVIPGLLLYECLNPRAWLLLWPLTFHTSFVLQFLLLDSVSPKPWKFIVLCTSSNISFLIIFKMNINFLRHGLEYGMNVTEKFWKMRTQNLIDLVYVLYARHFIGSREGVQAREHPPCSMKLISTSTLLYEINIQWPAVKPFWVWIMYKSKQMMSWCQDKRYNQLKPPKSPNVELWRVLFLLGLLDDSKRTLKPFQNTSNEVLKNKTPTNYSSIIFFFKIFQWTFYRPLALPWGAPPLLPLMPQNFGVIDLRHHFAIHNPMGHGLLDGL